MAGLSKDGTFKVVGAARGCMEIGTVFPQLEIGDDPAILADYARRVEAAGLDHVLAYDHVLGVDPGWEDWEGPYDNADTFHEPLTTFSYLAGITDDLEFATGILILPQRQTALVAKQAAQVDRFADGRFRLGVGVGWNPHEYVALGEDFGERGRRIEEQIDVLRELWTEPVVEFEGEYHRLDEVGINPRPVQQPIPVWMGGMADPVKRRVGRMAEGWFPQFQPGDEDAEDDLADVYAAAEEAGRDPDDVGIHGRFWAVPDDTEDWVERARAWEDLGADYLAISTMYQDLDSPEDHTALVEEVADEFADAGLL
jgi:probable F420-dependent oxidoreductase